MDWLKRNAEALQAIGAILTVVLAAIALAGVKYQVNGAAAIQREQSARDIYREFLNLSVSNPDLAAPDECKLEDSPREASYFAYFDYMLYAAEQSMSLDPELSVNFAHYVQRHARLLCQLSDEQLEVYEPAVADMIRELRPADCASLPPCSEVGSVGADGL